MRKILIFYSILLSSIIFIQDLKSQVELPTPGELFNARNYIQALEQFKKYEKEYPDDYELKHQIAVCYLNIYTDKSLAIPYLEACYKEGNYKKELLLDMGKAYQFAYRFKEAISYYNKYREKAPPKIFPLIDHYIETCENAEALIKKPINITFEHLGKEINSKFADYYPFVTSNEKTLFFTSRRDKNMGNSRSFNGYFTSDVYSSTVLNGSWTQAKNLGPMINTIEDEQCVGISPDGKKNDIICG